MDMAYLASIQAAVLLLVANFLQAVTITPLPFLGYYGFIVRPGSRPGKATFLGNEEASRVRRGGNEGNSHNNQVGTGYTIQKPEPGFYGKPSQYDYDSYRPWNNGGSYHREYYPKYKPETSYWDDDTYRNRRGHNCEPGRSTSFAGHGYFNNRQTPNLQGGGRGWSQGAGDESSSGTTEGSGYSSGGSSWDSGRHGGFLPGSGDNRGGPGSSSWNRPEGRPGGGNWDRHQGGPGGSGWNGPGGGSWNGRGSGPVSGRPESGSWDEPGGGPSGANWNGEGRRPGPDNWSRPGAGTNGDNWSRLGYGGGSWNGPGGSSWDRPSSGPPNGGSWSRPGTGGGSWNGPADGEWSRPGYGGNWNGPSGSSGGRSWDRGSSWSGNGGSSWDGSGWAGGSSGSGDGKWNSSPGDSRGDGAPEGTVGFYGRRRRD